MALSETYTCPNCKSTKTISKRLFEDETEFAKKLPKDIECGVNGCKGRALPEFQVIEGELYIESKYIQNRIEETFTDIDIHMDKPIEPKSLLKRIKEIEARQREYQMHDPECPAREVQKLNQVGGMYYMPKACTCWLNSNYSETN